LRVDWPLVALERLAEDLREVGGRVQASAQGHLDALGRPALTLELASELVLTCDRCGGGVRFPVAARRAFYFVGDEVALGALPVDDTEEEALVGSEHFDLRGLVEDELILLQPISPRHADGDPQCRRPAGSASVTAGASVAGEGEKPHPFAALAGLRQTAVSPQPPDAAAPASGPKGRDGDPD
jgi:uncharacterized protein